MSGFATYLAESFGVMCSNGCEWREPAVIIASFLSHNSPTVHSPAIAHPVPHHHDSELFNDYLHSASGHDAGVNMCTLTLSADMQRLPITPFQQVLFLWFRPGGKPHTDCHLVHPRR